MNRPPLVRAELPKGMMPSPGYSRPRLRLRDEIPEPLCFFLGGDDGLQALPVLPFKLTAGPVTWRAKAVRNWSRASSFTAPATSNRCRSPNLPKFLAGVNANIKVGHPEPRCASTMFQAS